jgi:pimeloyl-ACP methyl ester carboxylesterase
MKDSIATVLVPGLFCTPRLYAEQISALWQFGPVTIADHRRDESMAAIAQRILASAPPKFALGGLSMGGYIALEIMRQAPERVAKLALLDTAARPDTPEQTKVRNEQIELARQGGYGKIVRAALPMLLYRQTDEVLRNAVLRMAEESGPDAFIRQQRAIISRADSRPLLASIQCPTWIIVGEQDKLIPLDRSQEMANGIAGSRLVVIPECGHIATLEQPQLVTEALVEWLKQYSIR